MDAGSSGLPFPIASSGPACQISRHSAATPTAETGHPASQKSTNASSSTITVTRMPTLANGCMPLKLRSGPINQMAAATNNAATNANLCGE